jgi:hypothetical protein
MHAIYTGLMLLLAAAMCRILSQKSAAAAAALFQLQLLQADDFVTYSCCHLAAAAAAAMLPHSSNSQSYPSCPLIDMHQYSSDLHASLPAPVLLLLLMLLLLLRASTIGSSPAEGHAVLHCLGIQGAQPHVHAAQVVLCKHNVGCDDLALLVGASQLAWLIPLPLIYCITADAVHVVLRPLQLTVLADCLDTCSSINSRSEGTTWVGEGGAGSRMAIAAAATGLGHRLGGAGMWRSFC